jgi:hypothetical protein
MTSPISTPTPTLSRLVAPGSSEARLFDLEVIRTRLTEQFHLHQEISALPSSDRDALFKILWDAQNGDPSALEAVYDLVYDEVPVPMDEFILSQQFLGLEGQIHPKKVDLLVRFDAPPVRKGWLAIGSGGGKSFMVSIVKARIIYLLLCLKKPDLYYMLGPGSKIAAINLSVSKEQAKDVIYAEFLARIKGSPWFKGKFYKPLTSKCRFRKNIYVMSGGSAAISYFGYHTIFGSLDEASFLLDRQDRSVAEELCEALLKSLMTRFPLAYKLFVVSTLRSPDDFLNVNIERIKQDGVLLESTPTVSAGGVLVDQSGPERRPADGSQLLS